MKEAEFKTYVKEAKEKCNCKYFVWAMHFVDTLTCFPLLTLNFRND